MDPLHPDPATLAARNGLTRAYLAVFQFLRQRAATGDIVAQGIERELTNPLLPAPTHVAVRRWLSGVVAEPRLFNRATDPYTARDLMNHLNAVENHNPALWPSVYVEVVTALRGGHP